MDSLCQELYLQTLISSWPAEIYALLRHPNKKNTCCTCLAVEFLQERNKRVRIVLKPSVVRRLPFPSQDVSRINYNSKKRMIRLTFLDGNSSHADESQSCTHRHEHTWHVNTFQSSREPFQVPHHKGQRNVQAWTTGNTRSSRRLTANSKTARTGRVLRARVYQPPPVGVEVQRTFRLQISDQNMPGKDLKDHPN